MFTSGSTSSQRGGRRPILAFVASLALVLGLGVSTVPAHAADVTRYVDQANGSDAGD